MVLSAPAAAQRAPETYRVTPAATCVRAENLNGLVFLHNGCDQEVRAYWCVDLQATSEAVAPASCEALAAAEAKAAVEIEAGQSAALAVPELGGNLQMAQVQRVHIAACMIRTREVNVPHHFELSYTGKSVETKCLQRAELKSGQRSRLVELQLVPGQTPLRVRLIDQR
jgi:hypothetical protein